jgi:hypothetical protein
MLGILTITNTIIQFIEKDVISNHKLVYVVRDLNIFTYVMKGLIFDL